jgi:RNA polymerase-binding transcription factor DksA
MPRRRKMRRRTNRRIHMENAHSNDPQLLLFSSGAAAVRSADMGDRVRAPKREFRQSTPAELDALFRSALERGTLSETWHTYCEECGAEIAAFWQRTLSGKMICRNCNGEPILEPENPL